MGRRSVFETPFTPDGKQHGDVTRQCMRKTILTSTWGGPIPIPENPAVQCRMLCSIPYWDYGYKYILEISSQYIPQIHVDPYTTHILTASHWFPCAHPHTIHTHPHTIHTHNIPPPPPPLPSTHTHTHTFTASHWFPYVKKRIQVIDQEQFELSAIEVRHAYTCTYHTHIPHPHTTHAHVIAVCPIH